LVRMLETIKHRGRDDTGTFVDNRIALGCDRLAIVDLEGGHQPVTTEDCSVWAVLNGEIYNYRELRATLEKTGHKFKSLSDSEVLAHAYEEWGEQAFRKLNGMFALAVWDAIKKTLVIARDRVGIKPLYYTQADDLFAFASEAKAIIGAGLVDHLTVNASAVTQLLDIGYFLAPMSMFNELQQLPPASFLTRAEGSAATTVYWHPPGYNDQVPSTETVRNTLRDSVVRQTRTSDVPVSAFLSGGLDTSTIVAFASQARPEELRTFCMGFGEKTDEFQDARLVSEAFGTDHQEILIDASQGMKLFPRMVWHAEMPKVNLYSWFVDEAASNYGKVCLSGLGGDELFCGYANTSRFRRAHEASRIRKLPLSRQLTNIASAIPIERARYAKALTDEPLAYSTIITGFPPSEIDPEIPSLVKTYFSQRQDFVQEMIRCEFHTKLPYDYLLVEDAMSMAHTLEVRVPLLDDYLLQLMLGVPSKYQMAGDTGKLLLRQAMKGILPDSCFAKPKWGFSVDIYSWWSKALREYANKYLPESKFLSEMAGRRYRKVLRNIKSPPDPSRTRSYAMAWIMLGLQLWHQIFLDEHGREPTFSW